jgi:hypothetical protein
MEVKMLRANTYNRIQSPRAFAIRICFAIVLCVVSGCGLGDISQQINSSTQQAIAALNDAITKLSNANADWQGILGDLMSKLPAAEQTIKADVSDVLTHAIGAAGTQVTCILDFIGTRVREGLLRIKAKVLGQSLPPVEPSFCDANPAAVDSARVPNELKFIEFFGYNFDSTPAVQVVLKNGDQEVDVSNFLDRPSHYHMTLKFGANGVQLSPTSQRFIVRWNNNEVSTIGIIQPTTPVCGTRVKPFTPSAIDFIPPRTRGDREFSGHGPRVDTHVSVSNFGQRVFANIQMTAQETESDWTTASGSMSKEIYTPDPGWRVQQILGTPNADFNYTDSDTKDDTFNIGGNGPVSILTFLGDTSGDDAGIDTKVTVTFSSLRMVEIETTNCVSPFAVKVAEFQNALAPTTSQRLKPQIDAIPADIRKELPILPRR